MNSVESESTAREQPAVEKNESLEVYLELLGRSGVETLWHYTDIHGLIGMLQTSTIWATSHEFLNDSSEINYSIAMFQEKFHDALAATETRSMIDALSETFAPNHDQSVYISCFSENGDQLSQWRGYGGADSYAIGFNTRQLLTQATRTRSMIGRVQYGEAAAQKAAQSWAENAINAWRERYPEGYGSYIRERFSGVDIEKADWAIEEAAKDRYEFDRDNISHLIFTAALHKDSAFSEEAEWRMYQPSVANPGRQPILFRAGTVGVIPYISIPFQKSPAETTISSIMIGPGLDFEVRERGLRKLLDALSYPRGTKILRSRAPYRG